VAQTTRASGVPAKRRGGRREEIITVASRLLRTKGLTLQLQDIADELGVTYNALYHHFKSREDLLLHCFIRSAELMEEALAGADDATLGIDKVSRFLELFIEAATADATPPGRYVVALSDEVQRAMSKRTGVLQDQLVRLIEEGQVDGSITSCDPLITAVWILHTLYWWPEELRRKRRSDDVAETIFSLIRRALAA
jgi:AcrR family transcriptional regulator